MLTYAIHSMMWPTKMYSGANCSLQAMGIACNRANDAVMGATKFRALFSPLPMRDTEVGDDTHEGGPSSLT